MCFVVNNLVNTMSREPTFALPKEMATALLRHLFADRPSTAVAAAAAAAAVATVPANCDQLSSVGGASVLASRLRIVAQRASRPPKDQAAGAAAGAAAAAATSTTVAAAAAVSCGAAAAAALEPAVSSREVCDLLRALNLVVKRAALRRAVAEGDGSNAEHPPDAHAVMDSGVLPNVVDLLGEQRSILKTRPTKDHWFDTCR
jgi:hypothetical protein